MKHFILILAVVLLSACAHNRDNLEVQISFIGEGKYKICFKNPDDPNDDFKHLTYNITAITKTEKTRSRESIIYSKCMESNFVQLKLGAYTHEELKEMEVEFVKGNIKNVTIQVFEGDKYYKPFFKKKLENL